MKKKMRGKRNANVVTERETGLKFSRKAWDQRKNHWKLCRQVIRNAKRLDMLAAHM